MVRKRRVGWDEPPVADELISAVREISQPLKNSDDLDPLMERIGGARYVLLGEASHGTSEFYTWRRLISQRLIEEKGFSFIAVEGDWPDCYRINRFVKGYKDAGDQARDVLRGFERWPTWMWANLEIAGLAEWLREHNRGKRDEDKVGFYGLDVYSLWDSMHSVIQYLEKADGSAVESARRAFECFEPYGQDEQEYARATLWLPSTCEDEVVKLLQEIREQTPDYEHDGREAHFNAEQNALVAKNAEKYYRTMVRGDSPSWNVRDGHMVETLNRLMNYHGPKSKVIVWEHNTHIGDARATDMADSGMVNVGQLVREQHAAEGVVLVGFSSHHGTVIAGDAWGAPMHPIPVPIGRVDSWEDVLHRAGASNKLLLLDSVQENSPLLEERGHRAIGVVYRPQYEQFGNYVPTVLPRRYDALLYLDQARALHPLHVDEAWADEVPETYPSGV